MGVFIGDHAELLKALTDNRKNKKLVFTNGCFDILHLGHVQYLQEAKNQGDLLLVALNSDASVRELKGPERPIVNEVERAEVMAALGCVDFVTLFSDQTPLSLIQQVNPDVLVKGGDWPVEQIVGHEVVLASGGEVKSLKFIEGSSSTNIIEKIKNLNN